MRFHLLLAVGASLISTSLAQELDLKIRGDLGDVLALQGEVARAIAREVAGHLPAEESDVAESSRVDPEAYRAYVRGRYYLARRTPSDLMQALAQFERALDIDPAFARAWVGQADTHALLAMYEQA